jgi:hypothetical protein
MALYAFDGTGDRWTPGARWKDFDLHAMAPEQKDELLSTITPTAKTKKGRYLTNVVFMFKEFVASGIHAEYFPGVGSGAWFETNTGKTLDAFLGGAFGIGACGIAKQAFGRLRRNMAKGDSVIDIVGYSRGAATARIFADKIASDFKKLDTSLERPPEIRFVALFDTVASFGNPLNDNEIVFQPNLPWIVRNAFHAMSLDLSRLGFGLDRAYGNHVMEVWFRGGHGDVGGNSSLLDGSPNRLRTNISLVYMLKKAIASGIELKTKGLCGEGSGDQAIDYPINLQAPVSVEDKNFLNLSPGSDPTRRPRNHDIFHHSLFDESNHERRPDDTWTGRPIYSHPKLKKRDYLVIEEPYNESELADLRVLQLTPRLTKKFPDTQSIYDCLEKS